jgi:hypothetical protein
MVNVLEVGPKVRGLKPGLGDGFLRAIKTRSTPSFGGVKSRQPQVVSFYIMLKNLA